MTKLRLRESQKVALAKLCEPGRTFAALWAEPRSGKTAVSLRWLQHISPRVVVVVAPKIAETVWRSESAKWLDIPYQFYPLTAGNRYPELFEFKDMVILFVNYEQFNKTPYKRLKPFLDKVAKWAGNQGAMILDESHMIKTPSSVQGRHIRPLAHKWKYRLIVTGTPVTNPNQIDAVYGQWTFLDPDIRKKWPSAKAFRDYFGEWTMYKGYPELVRPVRQYELNAYLQPNVVTMAGSGAKVRTVKYNYTVPDEVSLTLSTMIKEGLVDVQGHTVVGLIPLVRLLRMRTLVAGWAKDDEENIVIYGLGLKHRLRALKNILNKTEGKTIVCCTHLEEIRLVRRALERWGVGVLVITGSVTDKNRVVERFQMGRDRVLLVQPRTVSMAVDISVANHLIWYTSDFNYVTFKQASDRIKLSPSNPTVWFICAKGTVDEDVWITLTKDHQHLHKTIKRIKQGKIT